MANKNTLIQGGDGTAIPTGFVGEKLTFTERAVSAVTGGYTANTNAVVTLTAGVWLLYGWMNISATASLTRGEGFFSTNSNNDATGIINESTFVLAGATLSVGIPLMPCTFIASSSTPIFAKAASSGANTSITFRGFAIRIG